MDAPRRNTSDLLARATVGVLFTLLTINILQDFLRTGRITGLLLLVSEALVVVLTVIRRPAQHRRSVGARGGGHGHLRRRPAAACAVDAGGPRPRRRHGRGLGASGSRSWCSAS